MGLYHSVFQFLWIYKFFCRFFFLINFFQEFFSEVFLCVPNFNMLKMEKQLPKNFCEKNFNSSFFQKYNKKFVFLYDKQGEFDNEDEKILSQKRVFRNKLPSKRLNSHRAMDKIIWSNFILISNFKATLRPRIFKLNFPFLTQPQSFQQEKRQIPLTIKQFVFLFSSY